MNKQPEPGDFGLSTIGGFLGFWINLGQAFIRDGSRYTHAFIVLDDNTVMEAMPGGAKITPIEEYKNKAIYSTVPLTANQRATIVSHARMLEGTPYSFLDYLSLGLLHFGIKPKWLRKYIQNKGHMICSQLVDEVYRRSGIHMFDDGRLAQDVTPGDLANWLLERKIEVELT